MPSAVLTPATLVLAAGDVVPSDDDGSWQVLLSGWGPATRSLARELRARGVDLMVTTLNPDGAAQAEADGHRVVMGDSTKSAVLEMAGLERTRLMVVAEDSHEQAVQIAGVVAGLARYEVPVLARPLGGTDLAELAAVGVHRVVDAEGASRHALTEAVLGALGGDAGPVPAVLLLDGGTGRRSTVDMSRVVVVDPAPDQPACGPRHRERPPGRRLAGAGRELGVLLPRPDHGRGPLTAQGARADEARGAACGMGP